MVIRCTWGNITAWNVLPSKGKCRDCDLQQGEDARRERALRELGLRTCAEPVEALSTFGMMRS